MRLIPILIIILFFSCSSPYYNTLYNAEKLYSNGERLAARALISRKNVNYSSTFISGKLNTKNPDLEKVLEKCASVLIEFGDTQEENSYADQAYYLMVKSSFYLERYDECLQIINRMESKSPKSELLNEIYIYKGDALAHLGSLTDAVTAFKLVAETSDINIYAESKMGQSKIYESQNQINQAIDNLSSFYFNLVSDAETTQLNEETHFNLIDYLTDLLNLNSQFDEIINVTENYHLFSTLEYKKKLAIKRLTALSRSTNREQLLSFIEEVNDDSDLSPETDFIDLIDFLKTKDQMSDSILSSNVSAFEKMNPTSELLTNLYSSYVDQLIKNNSDPDSLEKAYTKLLYYEKNPDRKSQINIESNIHKEFVKIYNDSKSIDQMKLKLDSMTYAFQNNELMDSVKVDTNQIIKLKQDISAKESKNKWDYANYYYENNELDKALNYFQELSQDQSDTLKQALAILFQAQVHSLKNQSKADSLYRYVYMNFDHMKENDDLIKKLNITISEKKSKSKILFEDFMNKTDLDKTKYEIFNRGYKQLIDSLDDKSIEKEKLKFNRIYILLRENTEPDSTIKYILDFKKTYPKSSFLSFLNRYDVVRKVEPKSEEINEQVVPENVSTEESETDDKATPQNIIDSKFRNNPNIQLLSDIKQVYPYKQTISIDVELTIDSSGEVTKVSLLNSNALDVQAKIDDICRVLKFNQSDIDLRSYKLTINLGDLR